MKFKRFLSVLLSLCILCSLCVFSVSADEAEDCTITILELPELVLGEAISDVAISVPTDAKYTVKGKWFEVTSNSYGDFVDIGEASGVFEEGKKYAMCFYVDPQDDWNGWTYADSEGIVFVNIMLNDEFLDYGYVYPEANDIAFYSFLHHYLLGERLEKISLENIPVAKAGENASVENIKVSEKDKDLASIFSAKWYEIDTETYDRTEFTGTFEKGKVYELSVILHTKDGYYFKDTEVFYNGDEKVEAMNIANYNLETYIRTDLREEIEKVNILNVQSPKLDETATTDGLKAEDGAKFTIESAKWLEINSGTLDEFTGKFENKKAYELEIQIKAAEGYRFAEETEIYFDNAPADEDDVYFSYFGEEELTVIFEADFYEVLDAIEFTYSETKEVGKEAKENAVTAPDDAKYTFNYLTLYVPDNEEEEVALAGVYENGKAYVTVIQFVLKDGYKLSDKTLVKINGETLAPSEYNFTTDVRGVIWADYIAFGKTPISKLEFNIVPLPDKTPKDITNLVPNGANYSVEKIEWYDDETNEEIKDTDKFEKGKKYYFYAELKVKDGYYIPTDAKITLNGSDFYGFEDANSNVFIYNEFGATVKSEIPVPATGDNTNLPIYALVLALSLGALVVLRKKQLA